MFLALSVAGWGRQHHQTIPPAQAKNSQQKPNPPTNLSDEERADIFMVRKSYDEAIEYYTRAINSSSVPQQNQSEVAALWNKIGICYQQKMDYRKARDAYKKSIRLNRDFAQPWNNLGTTYYLNKKRKKAIKFYRRAIKLSPLAASFHLNLGTAYFARKKYKKAFGEYRTAIELDPDILRRSSHAGTAVETRQADAKFYFYMAKVFASVGNASEAVRYLQHAMEEGFNNRSRILQDPDIKKISKDPAFVALMKNPPVAIKD